MGPVRVAECQKKVNQRATSGHHADTMALEWKPTECPENQELGFSDFLTHSATLGHKEEDGSGGWDRTNDLVINSD